jgi:hypothetical protein
MGGMGRVTHQKNERNQGGFNSVSLGMREAWDFTVYTRVGRYKKFCREQLGFVDKSFNSA